MESNLKVSLHRPSQAGLHDLLPPKLRKAHYATGSSKMSEKKLGASEGKDPFALLTRDHDDFRDLLRSWEDAKTADERRHANYWQHRDTSAWKPCCVEQLNTSRWITAIREMQDDHIGPVVKNR
jgi:hypothetical protein